MKRNFKFIVAAIAAIAMVGCAKDGGEKIDAPKGTETTAYFNISFPKTVTRAVDDTATPVESKIVDAWVFLFNDAQTLESKTLMTVAVDNKTATAGPIKTVTGKHYVYIVVNGNTPFTFSNDTNFPIPVEATSTPGMAMSAFLAKTIDAKTSLPKTDDYFLMTSYAEPTFEAPTAEVPSPLANKVKMGLGRAVGKVHMDGTAVLSSIPANTESVTSLAYKVMNNPNTMRAFQQYNMDNLTGTIVNVITGDGSTRTFYHRLPNDTPATGYLTGSNTAKAGAYVPENWNTISTTHNATSLIIQGQVKIAPSIKLRLANGTEGSAHVAGATFYRVWDKQTEKWLPLFFSAIPDADGMKVLLGAAGQNPDLVTGFISPDKYTMDNTSATDYEFFVAKYTNANAYWRLPLKNDGKSAIARNDYFWVTIKTIAEIGASTDSDDPDDDGVIPGKPTDPPTPIDETKVDITAEISVLPWNGIDQEGNI